MSEFSEIIGTKFQKINDQLVDKDREVCAIEYASLPFQKGNVDVLVNYKLINGPQQVRGALQLRILTCALVLINIPGETTTCTITLLTRSVTESKRQAQN